MHDHCFSDGTARDERHQPDISFPCKDTGSREKRVVSVMVEEDDSIWSIAKQYYTEECGSMKDYIAEIKKCNSISSDTIYAGYPLLVPVWASDAELPALEEGSL